MNAAHLTDGQVQQLHDGELKGEALRRARAHVEACGECRADLDGLGRLARLLREDADRAPGDFVGFAARVVDRAKVAPVLSLGERLRVRGREEMDERGRSWVAVLVALAAMLSLVVARPYWGSGRRETGSHVIAVESGMMPSIVLNLFDVRHHLSTAIVWVDDSPGVAAIGAPEPEPNQEPHPPPGSTVP